MRLTCNYREIRETAKKSLTDIEAISGVDRASLSRIERGMQLPFDTQIAGLEAAYDRPITEIYSPLVLLAIQEDEPK